MKAKENTKGLKELTNAELSTVYGGKRYTVEYLNGKIVLKPIDD